MSTGWESRAEQWLAWARTPGFDAYWSYRDAFFALLPAPDGGTLEVGCGERRVSRDLAARGHRVTALDASPTLLGAAARLDPGGAFCACVTHPFAERGTWADETFVLEGDYLGAQPFAMIVERGGCTMTFDGTMYALEEYARALEAAGLAIEAIREPAPARKGGDWARWHRIPMFLMWRARKPRT